MGERIVPLRCLEYGIPLKQQAAYSDYLRGIIDELQFIFIGLRLRDSGPKVEATWRVRGT